MLFGSRIESKGGPDFGSSRDDYVVNNSMRAKYLFDFYLQMDIACINGNFLAPDD